MDNNIDKDKGSNIFVFDSSIKNLKDIKISELISDGKEIFTVPKEIDSDMVGKRSILSNHFIWKYFKLVVLLIWFFLFVFSVFLFVIFFSSYPSVSVTFITLGYIIFSLFIPAILIPVGLYWGLRFEFKSESIMKRFASEKGYVYKESTKITELLKKSHLNYTGIFTHVAVGDIQGAPFQMGVYSYKIQSGKSSVTVRLNLCHIKNNAKISPILITPEFHQTHSPFFAERRLRLEGDFDKRYSLWVRVGKERESLEILTPDVMHLILSNSSKFKIEMFDDNILIYSNIALEDWGIRAMDNFTRELMSIIGHHLPSIGK